MTDTDPLKSPTNLHRSVVEQVMRITTLGPSAF